MTTLLQLEQFLRPLKLTVQARSRGPGRGFLVALFRDKKKVSEATAPSLSGAVDRAIAALSAEIEKMK